MEINLSKSKKQAKKLFLILWENLFWILILLFLFDFVIAGLLFYSYFWQREETKIEAPPPLQVNQDLVNLFTNMWQEKQENFENVLYKSYLDPFRGFSHGD